MCVVVLRNLTLNLAHFLDSQPNNSRKVVCLSEWFFNLMGNYKFKFSDMLPNAWFFKLKDMTSSTTSKTRSSKPQLNKKQHQPHPTPPPPPPPPITNSSSLSSSSTSSTTSTSSSLPFPPTTNSQRKSYHFTRDLNSPDTTHRIQPYPDTRFLSDPPRRSSTKRRSTNKKRSSIHHRKPAAGDEMLLKELGSGRGSFDEMVTSLTTTTTCQQCESKDNDYVGYNPNISPTEKFILPPIITKSSAKLEKEELHRRHHHPEQQQKQQRRKLPAANSPAAGLSRLRLRANSPRIMGGSRIRVQVNNGRRSNVSSSTTTTVSSGGTRRRGRNRSLSESLAVVKASVDPGRDFKESMVEMIKENNLRGSKDLEELLACYLSLNSDEYHELIIKVFKQIWFDINEIQFN